MILEVTCSDYGIIHIVKILKTIFQMIQILGPILAMVSLALIFINSVTGDNQTMTKNKKKIVNCLLALVITLFLPVFVNLVMGITFMKNTFEVSACWKAAESYSAKNSRYIPKKDTRKKSETFIIDPDKYKGTDDDPNASIRNNGGNSSNNNNMESGEVNSAASTSLKDSLASLALAQQNDPSHKGGKKYWQYMGFNSRVSWCASFVSWCVQHADYNGQKVSSILNYKSGTVSGWISHCKNNSKTSYHGGNSYTPSRGDLIFFDWNGGGADHIGIVYNVSGSTVHTIEGNTSDSVKTRQYSKNSSNIYGYCSW